MLINAKLRVQEFRDDIVEVGDLFMFKRPTMPAEVGIKVVTKDRGHACLSLGEGTAPTLLIDWDLGAAPVLVLPDATIVPVWDTLGRDGAWPSGGLYMYRKRHFISFTIGGRMSFVDLQSGELQDHMSSPFVWFVRWRLMNQQECLLEGEAFSAFPEAQAA